MLVQFRGAMLPLGVYKEKSMKKFVLKFLAAADIMIKDYTVAGNSITLEYEVQNNTTTEIYTVDLDEESTGVKVLFAMAPMVKHVIDNGDTLVLDGVERRLHPLVIKMIINSFRDPDINKKSARLEIQNKVHTCV